MTAPVHLRHYPKITEPRVGIPQPTGPDVGGPVNEIEDMEDYGNAVLHRVHALLAKAEIDPDTVRIEFLEDSHYLLRDK